MCAEYSYFWDCGVIGDGVLGPYSNDEFSDVWASITQFNRRSSFLVFLDIHKLSYGWFKVSWDQQTPNGGTITIDKGIAIVDGKQYRLIDTTTLELRLDGYYRILMGKVWRDQYITISMEHSSVSLAQAIISQDDGDQWEVPLLTASVSGGVMTVDEKEMVGDGLTEIKQTRWFNSYPVLGCRQGGHADNWGVGGAVNYAVGGSRVEIGSVAIAATPTTVTFAEAFPYTPVVIIMPYDTGATWSGNNIWISAKTAADFEVSLDSVVNFNNIFYFAIGAKA